MFSLLFYSSIFLCEIVIQFMYIFMQDNFQFHNILSFWIIEISPILIFLLSTVLVCQVYRHQPVGLLGLAAFGNDLPPDFPPQTEVLFDLNVSPTETNLLPFAQTLVYTGAQVPGFLEQHLNCPVLPQNATFFTFLFGEILGAKSSCFFSLFQNESSVFVQNEHKFNLYFLEDKILPNFDCIGPYNLHWTSGKWK